MACSLCKKDGHTKRTCSKEKQNKKVLTNNMQDNKTEFSEEDRKKEKEKLLEELEKGSNSYETLRHIRQILHNVKDMDLCVDICRNANINEELSKEFLSLHRGSTECPEKISNFLSFIRDNKGIFSYDKMKKAVDEKGFGNLYDPNILIEGAEEYQGFLRTILPSYINNFGGRSGSKTDNGAGERAFAVLIKNASKQKEGSDIIITSENGVEKFEVKGSASRFENNNNASVGSIKNIIISELKARGFQAEDADFNVGGKHSYNFNATGLEKLNCAVAEYNQRHGNCAWDLPNFIGEILTKGFSSIAPEEVSGFVDNVIENDQIKDIQLFLNTFAKLEFSLYQKQCAFKAAIMINTDNLSFVIIENEEQLFDKLQKKLIKRHDSLNWNSGRGFGLQFTVA